MEDDAIDESWLGTYADAITLLMAFFVMLLTFTKYDIPAFEEAVAAIKENVGGRTESNPTVEMQIMLQDVVFEMEADQVVTVIKDDKGLLLELTSGAFFKPGTADLNEAAIPVLKNMIHSINSPRYDYYAIEAEGHTDDDPISTPRYPSNWELSAGRASSVIRVFAMEGIPVHRLKASAYADSQPKVPNRTPDGLAIKENQILNRRVNIRVTPMSFPDRRVHDKRMEAINANQAQVEDNALNAEAEAAVQEAVQEAVQGQAETENQSGSANQ